MKEKTAEKYIIYKISINLTISVDETIKDRYWRTVSAVLEIKSGIKDCKNYFEEGGAQAGLNLFGLGVFPIILNSTESWTEI